jgi:hypothetical protein
MLSPSDFNNAVPQFTNGNYASNPINPQYVAEPDAENYNRGTEPLQTLPAQWWNWFINKFTARFNKVNIYVKNIFNELAQVLSIFNITPDGTEQTPTTSQLKTVFECCYPQYVKNDLYGNIAGTALGTAAVGTATTFARSDHVHPMPTCVACAGTASYLYAPSATGIASDCNGNFYHKDNRQDATWHIDSYGGNAVFAVYFEQNYVCAATFCGNLAGNASFINAPQAIGIESDCYGNFHQKQSIADSWWGIFNNSCDTVFKAYFNENYVCAATFCGNLEGNAATSTTTSYMNVPSAGGVCTDINGNFIHKSTCAAQYWHVDRYDGTSVFAVYFEQNYVCAATFCGNLNGNAWFINPPGQYGVCSDENGNLHQKEFINGANYQIFDYQNNPVMRVNFAENYVCAATFCGDLSGTATKANYLQSIYEGGVISDGFGNLKHNNNCSGNSWNIYNNAGQPMMTVQLENSVVTATTFCGTATCATSASCAAQAIHANRIDFNLMDQDSSKFNYYYYENGDTCIFIGNAALITIGYERQNPIVFPAAGRYRLASGCITEPIQIITLW